MSCRILDPIYMTNHIKTHKKLGQAIEQNKESSLIKINTMNIVYLTDVQREA